MPLKGDAKEVMSSMQEEYGDKRGKRVFYATANKQNRNPETWEKKSSMLVKTAAIPAALSAMARRPALTGAALGAGLGVLKGDDPADAARKGLVGAGIGAGVGAGAGMAHRAYQRRTNPYSDMPKVADVPGGLADTTRGQVELRDQAKAKPGRFGAQLRKGTRVELEHTDDRGVAQDIAKDHLAEDPVYYDKLEKMEKSKAAAKTTVFTAVDAV